MTRSAGGELLEFDPEIERTCRFLRKQKKNSSRTMEEKHKTMKELAAPDDSYQYSCIAYPDLEGDFELRSGLIHLLPKFQGQSGEDPNRHLHEFHIVCSTMKPQGISEEDIKLRAFPFSLTGAAKDWFYYLPAGYVASWIDMKKAFLEKYFPASRTAIIRKNICGIQQVIGETLYDYWERFKKLCSSCPQHQISEQLLVQYFYEGLLPMDRSMIDAAAGGALVNKTPEQARELISNMAENSQQFGGRALTTRGVSEVQAVSNEQREIKEQFQNLTSLVKQMALNNMNKEQNFPISSSTNQAMRVCSICASQEHNSDLCPNLQQDESIAALTRAQFQQKNDPFSSTYNPGWKNHPNLKYGNSFYQQQASQQPQQSNHSNFQQPYGNFQQPFNQGFQGANFQQPSSNFQASFQQQSPPFQAQNQGQSTNYQSGQHSNNFQQPTSFQNQQKFNTNQGSSSGFVQQQKLEEMIQQMAIQQQNLERQIAQLANGMNQMQTQGSSQLPSQTVPNPKENVSAITLRSGKSIASPNMPNSEFNQKIPAPSHLPQNSHGSDFSASMGGTNSKPSSSSSAPTTAIPTQPSISSSIQQNSAQEEECRVPLPFPQRRTQAKRNVEEEKTREYQELVNLFSKVEVNVPLLTMIKQIPKYAKFLKDLCVHKKKLKGNELVNLGKNVSALIHQVPQKCEDPGVFTVSCEIGRNIFHNAMLDLGASINVMPRSVFQMLGIGPMQPTGVVIQLADRSQTHPAGMIEDVLVKVKELIFPADFYILDMEGDYLAHRSPLILGRPFLKTARTKIDVYAGTLSMEIGDTVIQFSLFDDMKQPRENHSIMSIGIFDELVDVDLCADHVLLDDFRDTEDVLAVETEILDPISDTFFAGDDRVSVGDCTEPQGSPLLFEDSEGQYVSVGDCTEPQESPIFIEQSLLEMKYLPHQVKIDGDGHMMTFDDFVEYDGGKEIKLQVQEFQDLWLEAYENSTFYKEKIKNFQDKHMVKKKLQFDNKIPWYKSRHKLFKGAKQKDIHGKLMTTGSRYYLKIKELEVDGLDIMAIYPT
ncbi:uncharacterized protein LOC141823868 [Curcuma longa]|uniref:uncharacterized protein LOC141823868 n=1 Tax=Curcuma longa TaxID=136217 RepID=UPI003D9DF72A